LRFLKDACAIDNISGGISGHLLHHLPSPVIWQQLVSLDVSIQGLEEFELLLRARATLEMLKIRVPTKGEGWSDPETVARLPETEFARLVSFELAVAWEFVARPVLATMNTPMLRDFGLMVIKYPNTNLFETFLNKCRNSLMSLSIEWDSMSDPPDEISLRSMFSSVAGIQELQISCRSVNDLVLKVLSNDNSNAAVLFPRLHTLEVRDLKYTCHPTKPTFRWMSLVDMVKSRIPHESLPELSRLNQPLMTEPLKLLGICAGPTLDVQTRGQLDSLWS
jgi:hypothetical protein